MKFEPIKVLEEPKRSAPEWMKPASLFTADVAASLFAFGASYMIVSLVRAAADLNPITIGSLSGTFHLALVASLTAAVFLWFRSKGHYNERQALADQIGAVSAAAVTGLLTSAAIQFATFEVGSRLLTGIYWALLVPAILSLRLVVRNMLKVSGVWFKPAVMFTSQCRVNDLAAFIRKRGEVGVTVTHAVSLEGFSAEEAVYVMIEARRKGLAIVYAPPPGDGRQCEIIERLVVRGVPFILSPELGPVPHRASVMEFPPEDIALMEITNPLDRALAIRAKRAFDIMGALAGLIFLSPILFPIALMVKADGGPAFFRQQRIGKGGAAFGCMKFRSMAVDAEERLQRMIASDPAIKAEWEANYKLRNDPRVTKIGRVLRKTNLDELPQLINILRGDMSIVGPRPVSKPETLKYGDALEAYIRVRPGLTGLWQTNGRNDTTFEQRVKLDAWYVRNWSLWRDAVIIIRTIREVIFARGI